MFRVEVEVLDSHDRTGDVPADEEWEDDTQKSSGIGWHLLKAIQ